MQQLTDMPSLCGVFAFLTFVVFILQFEKKSWMSGVLWILLLMLIADLSYAGLKFNPFVPSSYVFLRMK